MRPGKAKGFAFINKLLPSKGSWLKSWPKKKKWGGNQNKIWNSCPFSSRNPTRAKTFKDSVWCSYKIIRYPYNLYQPVFHFSGEKHRWHRLKLWTLGSSGFNLSSWSGLIQLSQLFLSLVQTDQQESENMTLQEYIYINYLIMYTVSLYL